MLVPVVSRRLQKRHMSVSKGLVYLDDFTVPLFKLHELVFGAITERDPISVVVQPYWYCGANVPRLWDLISQPGRRIHLKETDFFRALRAL